jgi:uncharacterized protein (DUF2062 family)
MQTISIMKKPQVNANSFVYKIFQMPYRRFLKIRGEAREIALGFALGLFVGITPTMGIQMIIAVFFAALFKWNKISAAIGVWISNPLTAPVIYSITYLLGAGILGLKNSFRLSDLQGITAVVEILKKAPEILVALVIGGIVLGFPIAVLGYYLSYAAIRRYREGIKRKLRKQKEKIAALKAKRKAVKPKRSKKAIKPDKVAPNAEGPGQATH